MRRSPRSSLAGLGLVLLLGACASAAPQPDRPVAPLSPIGAEVVGQTKLHRATPDDSLIELARTYDLGYVELAAANPGIDPWGPGEGRQLTIPAAHILPPGPHEGIIINLAEQRLYYFDPDGTVSTFPIGVGREGADTPLGSTKVVRKRKDPTWTPPASARAEDPSLPRVVPAGPENPLGNRALYLGWPAYLIHGTNEPYGIGRRVSRGCIRLYPEDIERLYPLVAKGTPVRVIDEPVKVEAISGAIFVEAHPSLTQASQLEENGRFDGEDATGVKEKLLALSSTSGQQVDWLAVDRALAERRGFPIQVSGVAPSRTALQSPVTSTTESLPTSTTEDEDGQDVLADLQRDLTSVWSGLKEKFGGSGATAE